ncbi:MAG TPA: hypothetical protein VGG72_19170 [Bryobacteraceae bacterium]|jgi:Rod binding domain-containing protein
MPVEPFLPNTRSLNSGFGPPLTAKDSPEKIREAASQFEALMIGQILKASHTDEDEGWLGTGEDQTAGSLMGLAEDYFARAMAARGGFGLAHMIEAGLEHRVSGGPANNSSPEPATDSGEAPNIGD